MESLTQTISNIVGILMGLVGAVGAGFFVYGAYLYLTASGAGIKDVYDQYYTWTSSYSHSMWGAVRESSYQTCANPLHRLHRYPKMQPLEDCLQDTALLVDQVLHQLDHAYPAFEHRLLENSHPS